MKKIIFIAGGLSQPRIIKRINSFNNNFEFEVYGYKRDLYDCNKLSDSIPINILGYQKNGSGYLKKIINTIKDLHSIIKKNGKENVVFYSFGFVLTFFLFLFRAKYIYELSDIIYGSKKYNFCMPILKKIEKLMVKKSELTVMTSEGFKYFLFKDQHIPNVLIKPNQMSPFFKNIKRNAFDFRNKDSLNFSFIGQVRYPNTIFRFAKIIGEKFPNHTFSFYGEGNYSYLSKSLSKKFLNIYDFGRYKNPEDLESIYSKTDMVVTCYHTKSLNVRIAEPNKLYECMFFCKPIIVSEKTFLSTQVKHFGCGYMLDAYSDESIIKFIDNISLQKLYEMSKKESNIPTELLIDNSTELLERVKQILL